jgi:hypothetical protein
MIQVPVGVKLYTNEVAPDIRVYFQLGGTLDFKLAEKAKKKTTTSWPNSRSGRTKRPLINPWTWACTWARGPK